MCPNSMKPNLIKLTLAPDPIQFSSDSSILAETHIEIISIATALILRRSYTKDGVDRGQSPAAQNWSSIIVLVSSPCMHVKASASK